MTEQIQINRQTIYLTIENVTLDTESGIAEQENQFVGFFKYEPVTEISFGEQVKDANGENVVFHSIEQARNQISDMLKRIIYPPSFLNPMDYTADNLAEIMQKELTFNIGDFNSDEIQESITGTMTNCTLASASNPPNMPYSVRIMTNNGERRLRISDIISITR
ncbi:hypothetical protein [Psychroserpens luteus]|uniref:Uncharacterized protein n=1 Tax=Psychroserpens luteus TaxID=1434066 RepID=A0ABW5ZUD2_9FLAO|nr:hypothetical protein [Psychroserpens luteus]